MGIIIPALQRYLQGLNEIMQMKTRIAACSWCIIHEPPAMFEMFSEGLLSSLKTDWGQDPRQTPTRASVP